MNYYIYPAMDDAIRLNQIMWDNYVWDGENYIFPFGQGTICYYDVNIFPWDVTELLNYASVDQNLSENDRNFISDILANKKTYEEAVSAGWIQ